MCASSPPVRLVEKTSMQENGDALFPCQSGTDKISSVDEEYVESLILLLSMTSFISQDNNRLDGTSTLSHEAQRRVRIPILTGVSAGDEDIAVGGAAVEVFSGEGEAEYVGAAALEVGQAVVGGFGGQRVFNQGRNGCS
nr:hypothetical protein Iba_chr15aCG16200 [Ipomoea batatas]